MAVRPFTEYEQRFLLTEILKTSNAPIDALVNIIREQRFVPNWDDVGLPAGRNVKSCVAELASLNFSVRGDSNLDGSKQPPRGIKRTHSASGFYGSTTPATKTREIKPKPAASSDADKPTTPAPATGSTRKRGRPSNAELAQRVKEASDRGEVYQGAGATKRKSLGDQPVGEPPAHGSEPPAKRGRGRPPKNKVPLANPDSGEKKPSEEVAASVQAEVEDASQYDETTKETRETLEVVARAATTSEALTQSRDTATNASTSVLKKMLGLGQATTPTPSSEQAARATAC